MESLTSKMSNLNVRTTNPISNVSYAIKNRGDLEKMLTHAIVLNRLDIAQLLLENYATIFESDIVEALKVSPEMYHLVNTYALLDNFSKISL